MRFVRTAEETAGELLVIDLSLRPHGAVAAAHVHPNQEERFEVVDGPLRIQVGRRWRTVQTGEVVTVPPGAPHRIGNPGDREGRVTVEFRPALRTQLLLERAFALMNVHGLRPTPRFVAEFCTLLEAFRDEMRTPYRIADAGVAVIARLSRWLGFRPTA